MHTFLKDFFSKEWREFILFHSKVVKFKKNEVIFSIGHETQGIYFIIDGKVKVTTVPVQEQSVLLAWQQIMISLAIVVLAEYGNIPFRQPLLKTVNCYLSH